MPRSIAQPFFADAQVAGEAAAGGQIPAARLWRGANTLCARAPRRRSQRRQKRRTARPPRANQSVPPNTGNRTTEKAHRNPAAVAGLKTAGLWLSPEPPYKNGTEGAGKTAL